MKKLILVLLACFFIMGQTWHTANQHTVGWDPVTEFPDGTPIDPQEVSYRVYISKSTNPDRTDAIKQGDTTETTFVVTLSTEGCYFVGVSTVRTVDGSEVSESLLAWSNQPEFDWGICYYEAFPAPGGLTPNP